MSADAVRQENRQRVIEFFRSGVKDADDVGRLGIEVEHHVVADDGTPISYEPTQGYVGVRELLEHLSTWYPERAFNLEGDLLGLSGPEGSVTLEPSAQLEFSAAPYPGVAEVARAYGNFYERVRGFLGERGAHLEAWGYHPSRKAQELTLIPKKRYGFMDAYFANIGSHGDRMMRASSSTQVSVDFKSEADAVRKMRVATVLAPVLAAIADNTYSYEAQANYVPIRRLQMWREVDNLRCGTVPHVFEEGFGFATYADWLLGTPPIFITRPAAGDPDGPQMRPFFTEPASDAYADAPMSGEDVEHLISMFWPDVRLKRFVEIRPADSLPYEQMLGYASLVKGIFYSEDTLRAVEEELGVDARAAASRGAWPLQTHDVDDAIDQVQKRGFDGQLYGLSLAAWEERLFDLARVALPADERAHLDPLADFARSKPWWRPSEL